MQYFRTLITWLAVELLCTLIFAFLQRVSAAREAWNYLYNMSCCRQHWWSWAMCLMLITLLIPRKWQKKTGEIGKLCSCGDELSFSLDVVSWVAIVCMVNSKPASTCRRPEWQARKDEAGQCARVSCVSILSIWKESSLLAWFLVFCVWMFCLLFIVVAVALI